VTADAWGINNANGSNAAGATNSGKAGIANATNDANHNGHATAKPRPMQQCQCANGNYANGTTHASRDLTANGKPVGCTATTNAKTMTNGKRNGLFTST